MCIPSLSTGADVNPHIIRATYVCVMRVKSVWLPYYMCQSCRHWNMLLTGYGSRPWQPYRWHHCCISMSSRHMGQTYRSWVDDMLMRCDHCTFLSTWAWSSKEMFRFTCTFRPMCAATLTQKPSGSLNNTSSCAKNNVRRQPVEMIACSSVNDKFPHKQTLTAMISPDPPLSVHVL